MDTREVLLHASLEPRPNRLRLLLLCVNFGDLPQPRVEAKKPAPEANPTGTRGLAENRTLDLFWFLCRCRAFTRFGQLTFVQDVTKMGPGVRRDILPS